MGVYHCNTWKVVTLCLAFCLNVLHVQGRWVNDYDETFGFTCSSRRFLHSIVSVHGNRNQDRRFHMTCRRMQPGMPATTRVCRWTGYVTNFDEAVIFRCPGNEYVAGISSYHINIFEDRRFSFLCCQMNGIRLHSCSQSGYVNGFEEPSVYIVPEGRVLKGMVSDHDNHTEDRRFQYETCVIERDN